jgi:hypothetical protein
MNGQMKVLIVLITHLLLIKLQTHGQRIQLQLAGLMEMKESLQQQQLNLEQLKLNINYLQQMIMHILKFFQQMLEHIQQDSQ